MYKVSPVEEGVDNPRKRIQYFPTSDSNDRNQIFSNHKSQNLIIEKRVFLDKIKKKTKEYQAFVLNSIFSEYELKEYPKEIKNIIQKNEECDKGLVNFLHEKKDGSMHIGRICIIS